ncbi:hypothetical protein JTB14_011360 [Gonioctena quinquepunctata]|nr:hypothetical protein JTB14_011360 [Gonioctena quinquepunctata]
MQAIEASGGLAPNQHEFRKGHSTVDAVEAVMEIANTRRIEWCLLITLDVRDAFNTATWSLTIRELIRREITQIFGGNHQQVPRRTANQHQRQGNGCDGGGPTVHDTGPRFVECPI